MWGKSLSQTRSLLIIGRATNSKLVGNYFQGELTAKGHEVIALKSEIRDLLQKLESKERRIDELEGRRPERCDSGNGGEGNCCDDQLAADKLCSLVERLNEQVSCWLGREPRRLSSVVC